MGRHWYDDGKLRAQAAHLRRLRRLRAPPGRDRLDDPGALVAEGASAGGLLIGAVANQAPDAFGGLVAGVPFVDTLTSMLDASLPLTVTEYDEWGNPAGDPAAYDDIAAYAPYDNVARADLPADPGRDLAATTPGCSTSSRPSGSPGCGRRPNGADVLLRTEMSAGHGGVSGRYQAWRDRAFTLAWILDRMGLADQP